MALNNKIYNVYIDGMKCMHCAKRVEDKLATLADVKKVKVDLDGKLAKVVSKSPLDEKLIQAAIEELGFTFKSLECKE